MSPLQPRGLIFRGEQVRMGKFRARPQEPHFIDSGPARAFLVVFPRTAVRIKRAGAQTLVADPTQIVFYNEGQQYQREAIAPQGDRSDWFAFSEEALVQAMLPFDESAADRPGRPFVRAQLPSAGGTYLEQRLLFAQAEAAGGADPLFVEEAALRLLGRAVGAGYRALGRVSLRPDAAARRRQDELAEAALSLLGRRFADRVSLAALASSLGVSPFHLCRVFKQRAGRTIHQHLGALRLHHGLEPLLEGPGELTALGLSLGYSSHSHFTLAFRTAFGATPSAVRRRLRKP